MEAEISSGSIIGSESAWQNWIQIAFSASARSEKNFFCGNFIVLVDLIAGR